MIHSKSSPPSGNMHANIDHCVEVIEQLHKLQLYRSSLLFTELAVSLYEQGCNKRETKTPFYHLLELHGDALLDNEEFQRAEIVYRQALSVKLASGKECNQNVDALRIKICNACTSSLTHNFTPLAASFSMSSSLSSILRMVRTNVNGKLSMDNNISSSSSANLVSLNSALDELSKIQPKNRSCRLNYMMGHIYLHLNMKKDFIKCHTEVLRQSPFTADIIFIFINLGLSYKKICEMVNMNFETSPKMKWFGTLLQACFLDANYEHQNALASVNTIEKFDFPNSYYLVALQGALEWKSGNYTEAVHFFEKARSLDPFQTSSMELYADSLRHLRELNKLNKLGSEMIEQNRSNSVGWLAMSHYSLLIDKPKEGIKFAEKAMELDPQNSRCYVVLGTILLEMNRFSEASKVFLEGYQIQVDFTVYQGLVECLLRQSRYGEGKAMAQEALNKMPGNGRAITLLGAVQMNIPTLRPQARKLFQKTLALNPYYMEAVTGLVQLDVLEKKWTHAIELLKEHLQHETNDLLHSLIGDVYTLNSEYTEAIMHYNMALSLNAYSERAKEGIHRVTEMKSGSNINDESIEEDAISVDSSYEFNNMSMGGDDSYE